MDGLLLGLANPLLTTDTGTTLPAPGDTLAVAPDTVFSVPYNGAQLPTAFRAYIRNNGSAADIYNLTFSNVPTGFTLLNSGASVTIPAGETGILGIYLQPNAGQPIPPPGTQLSFTVTATSTTHSSISQTQTETFTVPDIDAVTVTSDPTLLNTIPGTPVSAKLTLTDVGNVPETGSLAATLPSGLTASRTDPGDAGGGPVHDRDDHADACRLDFFLRASASSFVMPSLMGLGAPSTRSLASLEPRLSNRTALMTLIVAPTRGEDR